jgi:hypothetical protein
VAASQARRSWRWTIHWRSHAEASARVAARTDWKKVLTQPSTASALTAAAHSVSETWPPATESFCCACQGFSEVSPVPRPLVSLRVNRTLVSRVVAINLAAQDLPGSRPRWRTRDRSIGYMTGVYDPLP